MDGRPCCSQQALRRPEQGGLSLRSVLGAGGDSQGLEAVGEVGLVVPRPLGEGYRFAQHLRRRSPALYSGQRYPGEVVREGPPETTAIASEEARLTDEQWALVLPLLPPQRGSISRPPNDHRAVLGSILWVARMGSSWQEMAEEYGDFTTADKRWRIWDERGLWRRIILAEGHDDLAGPAVKDRN